MPPRRCLGHVPSRDGAPMMRPAGTIPSALRDSGPRVTRRGGIADVAARDRAAVSHTSSLVGRRAPAIELVDTTEEEKFIAASRYLCGTAPQGARGPPLRGAPASPQAKVAEGPQEHEVASFLRRSALVWRIWQSDWEARPGRLREGRSVLRSDHRYACSSVC